MDNESSQGIIEKEKDISVKKGHYKRPWEQLDGESDLWYSRFLIYKSLENRTVAEAERISSKKLPEALNVASGVWKDMCSEWRWVERAQAWDLYKVKKALEKTEVTREELFDDNLEINKELMIKLKRLIKADPETQEELDKLKISLAYLNSIAGKGKTLKRANEIIELLYGKIIKVVGNGNLTVGFDVSTRELLKNQMALYLKESEENKAPQNGTANLIRSQIEASQN